MYAKRFIHIVAHYLFYLFIAPPALLKSMPEQYIYLERTSVITCEVDRGNPLASIHWLRIQYDNTGKEVPMEITNSSNPRFTIVSDGLQITSVQLSDEGVYRCYVYNMYGNVILDIQATIRGLCELFFFRIII